VTVVLDQDLRAAFGGPDPRIDTGLAGVLEGDLSIVKTARRLVHVATGWVSSCWCAHCEPAENDVLD